MAHIEDRWMRKQRGPDGKYLIGADGKPALERDPQRYGKGSRYRVRYINDAGEEKSRSFAKKIQAEGFKKELEADLLRGTYIDPDAGAVTFKTLAEEVIETRTLDPASREVMRARLDKHVYPVIGGTQLGKLAQRPSLIQALVARLGGTLGPSTVGVVMAHVGLVFAVAIDDGLIGKNPLRTSSVVLPKVVKRKLVPWTPEQVFGMADALPARFQAMVAVGAGLGLRQGEILGLSPDDVDWLRGVVSVRRQIKLLSNKPIFALPKGEKVREIPLPESVKIALSEHVREFTPLNVTRPWRVLDGDPVTVKLFFSQPDNAYGGAVYKSRINEMWHRALATTGIVPKLGRGERGSAYREHGMHMLRHYFASTLLTEGESIQAVSEWLGHHDPTVTLKVYAHLMPKSEQRMRTLIDRALTRPDSAADGPQTAQSAMD